MFGVILGRKCRSGVKLEAGKGKLNSKEAFPGREIHEGAEWSSAEQWKLLFRFFHNRMGCFLSLYLTRQSLSLQ